MDCENGMAGGARSHTRLHLDALLWFACLLLSSAGADAKRRASSRCCDFDCRDCVCLYGSGRQVLWATGIHLLCRWHAVLFSDRRTYRVRHEVLASIDGRMRRLGGSCLWLQALAVERAVPAGVGVPRTQARSPGGAAN